MGKSILANRFHHLGFTIEYDLSLPKFTIDGRMIKIKKDGKLYVYSEHPEVNAKTPDQLGRNIIESWRKIKDNREDIKEKHLRFLRKGVKSWNRWRINNPQIRPILYNANLKEIDLCDDEPVDFSNANLIDAILTNKILRGANFHEANLSHANLSNTDLTGANFCRSDLHQTNLSRAILHDANLQGTKLAKTIFRGAELVNCRIYGLSAWDLKLEDLHNKKTIQKDLKIIYKYEGLEGKILVDDLRVAQFIFLLLHNKDITSAIDTITHKVVLILGSFAKERKPMLDTIRSELRNQEYVPVLFDFTKPGKKSLMETVMILAGMARFIIADVTAAAMVREELRSIVEKYPSKPIPPILLDREIEYQSLTEMKVEFKNILDTYTYKDEEDVISNLKVGIIEPAKDWLENRKLGVTKTQREIQLEKENKALKKRLKKSEAQ